MIWNDVLILRKYSIQLINWCGTERILMGPKVWGGTPLQKKKKKSTDDSNRRVYIWRRKTAGSLFLTARCYWTNLLVIFSHSFLFLWNSVISPEQDFAILLRLMYSMIKYILNQFPSSVQHLSRIQISGELSSKNAKSRNQANSDKFYAPLHHITTGSTESTEFKIV